MAKPSPAEKATRRELTRMTKRMERMEATLKDLRLVVRALKETLGPSESETSD